MSTDHQRPPGRVEAALAALIDAMPQPAVLTDALGAARHVNAPWLALGGARPGPGAAPWLSVQAPEAPEAAALAWTQARQDARPFDAAYVMHGPAGPVTVQWHHAPLRVGAPAGPVTGWLCTGTPAPGPPSPPQPGEARAREATLEHLALQVSGLGDAFMHLPLGVLIVDAQARRVALVNPQAQRLLGVRLAPGMTLGRLEELRVSGRDARPPEAPVPLRRALVGTPVSGEELDLQRPDGARVRLRLNAAPTFDPFGRVASAVLTLEDVSGRRDVDATEGLSREMLRAREAVTLHGGEPVTPARFLTLMGELHEQLGSPSLEGRLIALLLLRAEPVSLGAAAATLGVSKVAVSKVSAVMQQRGDLQVIRSFSSREHLLALTDHNYIRDLSVRRVASWAISILCDSLLRTNHLDDATTRQVRTHLETHTRVAVALEQVLSPIERRQAAVLATHLRENWDAVAPGPEKTEDSQG